MKALPQLEMVPVPGVRYQCLQHKNRLSAESLMRNDRDMQHNIGSSCSEFESFTHRLYHPHRSEIYKSMQMQLLQNVIDIKKPIRT